jgi:hypothetical protein
MFRTRSWIESSAKKNRQNRATSLSSSGFLVELRGLEPLTPCMPCRCATSCATAPNTCLPEGSSRRKQPVQLNGDLPVTPIGSRTRFGPGSPNAAYPSQVRLRAGKQKIRRNLSIPADYPVELRGLEPLTPCMPCRCATSCATAPDFFAAPVFSPKQLKYLRTAFPKIPNRAYSVL